MEVYTINIDYRDLAQEGIEEHLKTILEQKIGREIFQKINFNCNKMEDKKTICIDLEFKSADNKIMNSKEIRMYYRFRDVKEFETVFINRKDEVTTYSEFYTGQKLSWKERVQAFFKGKLYGGKLETREKVEEKR